MLRQLIAGLSLVLLSLVLFKGEAFTEGGGAVAVAGGPAVAAPAGAPMAGALVAPIGGGFGALAPAGSASSAAPATMGGSNVTSQTVVTNNSLQSAPAAALQAPSGPVSVQAPTAPVAESSIDLSVAERAMQETADGSQKAKPQTATLAPLQQFGYSFFRGDARGFAPLTDVPVGNDYILGIGDRINLSIWGSMESNLELEVNQNGDLVIPRVGTIRVAGVSYGQLPGVLKGQLGQYLKDFHLSVTMSRLRLVKVYVVGQVKAPGDYNVPGLSTVLNVLTVAGGPTKNGSLRSIVVKREGKVVETVDLYDFFLKGDKSKDIRLLPGDTIYVPSIGPVAGISGNVRRPAIYELKDEKTLKDLLVLADGLVPTGYLQRVQISRVDAHDKRTVSDINLDPKSQGRILDGITASVAIKDLDVVKIFPIDATLRGYVRLDGYVLRPGDYALKSGMRVEALLAQDNLLPEYYGEAAQIIRLVAPDYHPEVLYFNVKQAMAQDPQQNIALQEFDTVKIFSRWEMEEMPQVRVSGEVQKPGVYRLLTGMRVRDLLVFAGNLKLTAFTQNAEITRTDYSKTSVKSYPIIINLGKALAGDPQHNIVLEKFDELYIRKIPNWSEETARHITLKGEFVFPGVYPVYRGERLSSVIQRAGGYTEMAYLRAAKLTRRSVQEQQQKRMDEALQRAEKDLMQKQASLANVATSKEELESTKVTLEALAKSIDQMRKLKAEGRIVLALKPLQQFENSTFDLVLEGGETLEVPPLPGVVHVLGNVYNQTSFVYEPEMDDVDSYLEKAGGPTSDAESSEMYVVKADGTVFSRQQSSVWSFGGFGSSPLLPGDTLVVPQKLERIAWMREIKDITQILANMAVAAGTIWLGLK